MKKLLSCVVLVAVSLGFSISSFAADTLIASGGYGSNYFPSTCKWNYQNIATPGGLYTQGTLVCSGVSVASTGYYGGLSGPAAVTAIGSSYYAVKKDLTPGANGYNWAIYKKAAVCPAASTVKVSGTFTDLTAASYSRNLYEYENRTTNRCPAASGCKYDIVAVTGGYDVWCR